MIGGADRKRQAQRSLGLPSTPSSLGLREAPWKGRPASWKEGEASWKDRGAPPWGSRLASLSQV